MSRALKVPREGRDHWKSVENSPLLLRVHELPRDQSYVPSSNDPEGCGGEVNMGHLPMDRMVVMLKAANAKESVLRYVKEEFKCEHCMRQRREISRRPAAFPRTFEFNRIIGVDTFFVKWKGKSIPFLNVVDHGSNWQTVVMTRPVGGDTQEPSGGNPTSAETWHHFTRCWIRPFGVPEMVISDGGMEFRDRFERGLEQLGCHRGRTGE